MRVGIVGGAGFVGRHLYRAITTESDHAVHVFDLHRTDDIAAEDFTALDVTQPESVRGAFDGLELVYYKTGVMNPEASFGSPFLFHQLNLAGALRVLEACVRSGVRQFVYDSTECVFGLKNRAPFEERATPAPDSVYGATKANCENYLKLVSAQHDIDAAVLRYPRVVSAANPNVFTAIRDKISQEEEIRLTANGEKRFDVVHIDDVVRWNRWFLDHRDSCILHVTAGFQLTVMDVIRGLAQKLRGRPDYPKIELTADRTVNDRLLPDSMLLDDRFSRERTGLDNRHTRFQDFLDLF